MRFVQIKIVQLLECAKCVRAALMAAVRSIPNYAADLWVSFELFTAVFDIHFMEHYWTFKCSSIDLTGVR